MDDYRRVAVGLKRRIWSIAMALGCMVTSGCASDLMQPWAKFSSDKALAAAATDDSFPSAEEVGLAANK